MVRRHGVLSDRSWDPRDDDQKKAILLYVGGPGVREIYKTKAKADDNFDTVVKALEEHFKPLKNLNFQIFKFGQLRQTKQESVDDFAVRLRAAALLCEFWRPNR